MDVFRKHQLAEKRRSNSMVYLPQTDLRVPGKPWGAPTVRPGRPDEGGKIAEHEESCSPERARALSLPQRCLVGVPDALDPATVGRAVAREFSLTRRETQVLLATTRGNCTKETAIELGLSGKTVEYFWARIFRKLHCACQVEVMALLLRRALPRNPSPQPEGSSRSRGSTRST